MCPSGADLGQRALCPNVDSVVGGRGVWSRSLDVWPWPPLPGVTLACCSSSADAAYHLEYSIPPYRMLSRRSISWSVFSRLRSGSSSSDHKSDSFAASPGELPLTDSVRSPRGHSGRSQSDCRLSWLRLGAPSSLLPLTPNSTQLSRLREEPLWGQSGLRGRGRCGRRVAPPI